MMTVIYLESTGGLMQDRGAMSREQAIDSGVENAVQTVIDGDQTVEWVREQFAGFVSEGLQIGGFGDRPTEADMSYARSAFAY